ncbi:MAG: hypothetical protein M5R36_17030 [Deltaproteobacteria bacterium]|nr:hypothetical protein [Deltaproteobacteria bacterium]
MTAFSTARRWTVRIAVVAAAAVATLFMADLVARAVKPDVPLLKGFLYRQVADHEAHQYDPNPDILFRLRPGRYEFSSHTVTVNQQARAALTGRPRKRRGRFASSPSAVRTSTDQN